MVGLKSSRRVKDILAYGITELETAGIAEARVDASLLLGFCLNKSRTELYLASRDPVTELHERQFFALLSRRKAREPVAYILGEQEFWSLPFHVTPAVLVPRPETEFLIETVLAHRNLSCPEHRCLDLCCGSGVIAIVLSVELGLPVIAVDVSSGALAVARKNCLRHRSCEMVSLVQSDLFSCFNPKMDFSLIVSNPPYVCRDELYHTIEPEVALFEPHLALDGGFSGLDVIIRIRDSLPNMLRQGGDFFMEIGDQQGEAVTSLFFDHGRGNEYQFVSIIQDYAGRDRVAHIRSV